MSQTIIVTNALNEPQTTAEIIIQGKKTVSPKVSVIMPVYNAEPFLKRCLDSVLTQTLKDIEIICINDGSTDNSLEVLKEYAAVDDRITVITQQNLHAGIARNAGICIAKGEYFSFLDSDDFFRPDMLETLLNSAQTDKSDIVVCGYYRFDHTTSSVIETISPPKNPACKTPFIPLQEKNTLFAIHPAPWNKLFKSSLFAEHTLRFENLQTCNDYTCIYTALVLASKISIINTALIYYRTNSGTNISASRAKYAFCLWLAVSRLYKNLTRYKMENIFFKALTDSLRYSYQYEMSSGSPTEQKQFRKSAKKYLPLPIYKEFTKPDKSLTRKYYLFGFIPFLKITENFYDCTTLHFYP